MVKVLFWNFELESFKIYTENTINFHKNLKNSAKKLTIPV